MPRARARARVRARVQWADVWVGAWVTSLLFVAGKPLIGSYIGHSGITTAFGAAASLIVVLLYVYYSTQIFLFGAEFTWVYAHQFGSRRGQPLFAGIELLNEPLRSQVASDDTR